MKPVMVVDTKTGEERRSIFDLSLAELINASNGLTCKGEHSTYRRGDGLRDARVAIVKRLLLERSSA